MEHKDEKIEFLMKLIFSAENTEDLKALFDDMCTRREVENMAERVYGAKLLMEGNTYTQVIAKADLSSATLSRISQCVQYGKGYSKFLK